MSFSWYYPLPLPARHPHLHHSPGRNLRESSRPPLGHLAVGCSLVLGKLDPLAGERGRLDGVLGSRREPQHVADVEGLVLLRVAAGGASQDDVDEVGRMLAVAMLFIAAWRVSGFAPD